MKYVQLSFSAFSGCKLEEFKQYLDMICDEVNVKNVLFENFAYNREQREFFRQAK